MLNAHPISFSPWVANTACAMFTVLYVGSLYLLKKRTAFSSNRDHPHVILSRLQAATSATVLIVVLVPPCVFGTPVAGGLLFLGPLSLLALEHVLPFQRHFSFQRDVYQVFFSLAGQRNYLVAPITEEVVFRACTLAVLSAAHHSKAYLIFVSPLYFGLAHVHHAWEKYCLKMPLSQVIVSSLFQFMYTSVFGWYASFVFLRTGSVWPPILCHVFCNSMGFPDIEGVLNRSLQERYAIGCCYGGGIALFWWCLYPWTLSSSMY
ncbi:CAAX protease self-immunity-domain-containing protein [Spinellus fusiger]|nr:CAAX protease self-immunity-domain-containing protein [Spinellus fusiger]